MGSERKKKKSMMLMKMVMMIIIIVITVMAYKKMKKSAVHQYWQSISRPCRLDRCTKWCFLQNLVLDPRERCDHMWKEVCVLIEAFWLLPSLLMCIGNAQGSALSGEYGVSAAVQTAFASHVLFCPVTGRMPLSVAACTFSFYSSCCFPPPRC